MKRREFIKKATLTTAGAFVAPYILPSGRLFAPTGSQIAPHVVLIMFAGGIRNQETVDQLYLQQSQYTWNPDPLINVTGNIMPNMLSGPAPASKKVYGTGNGGINPRPAHLTTSIQDEGVLFKEVNAIAAGHYAGSIALLQGNTNNGQALLDRPTSPTVFEYLRKHGGYKATDTWFVGNSLVNSVPLYNHSDDPNYGAEYGANMFIPHVTFGDQGDTYFKDAKIYHPQNELSPMYKMKYFLDNSYESLTQNNVLDKVGNTEVEKAQIKTFMKDMFALKAAGNAPAIPGNSASDAQTVAYALEVMKEFTPALTVIKIDGPDTCHSDFTGYLQAIHAADNAVGYLWQQIKAQIPTMAQDTIILATPDCGRNENPNPILDNNSFRAFDHSDLNTRRVFTLMAGKTIGNQPDKATGTINSTSPLNTDAALTIGHILGVETEMINAGYLHPQSESLIRKL